MRTGQRILVALVVALVAASAVLATPSTSRVRLADFSAMELRLVGAGDLPAAFADGRARTLALATGDLDRDGYNDLLTGLATPEGGFVAVILGSALGFVPAAEVFATPVAPDFLAIGDFDADGRPDVAAARLGEDSVYLMQGDGVANFRWTRRLVLSGVVSAVTAGEFDVADGLPDLAVGVVRAGSAEVQVFSSIRGAVNAEPSTLAASSVVNSLAFGLLDGDARFDLAVAAGRSVALVRGGDLFLEPPRFITFDFPATSLVAARFRPGATQQVAVLLGDGTVHVLEATGGAFADSAEVPAGPGAARLGRAKVLAGDGEDLIVLAPSVRRVRVLSGGASLGVLSTELDAAGLPAAVLSLRVNGDGLEDLVLANTGQAEPALALTGILSGPFTVNSTADNHDATPDGACADAVGNCTLRAAIEESNFGGGPTTINFNLGAGTPVIPLSAPLPSITSTVTIDGATAGATRIEINCNSASAPGLHLAAGSSGSLLKSLVVNQVGGSGNPGVKIESANNVVENCHLGLKGDGSTPVNRNAGGGVVITGAAATNNLVGGSTAAARNVISYNATNGVKIDNGASQNTIAGNYIGSDVNGGAAVASTGNTASGVLVGGGQVTSSPASNNTIGGAVTAPGQPPGNVISRNSSTGVEITNLNSNGNLVQGTLIGTQANGTTAMGNLQRGVLLYGGPQNSTVGGSTSALRNVISGNGGIGWSGVELNQANTNSNTVAGNYIGVDSTGSAALSNAVHGVYIAGGPQNNTVGGPTTTPGTPPGNVISGNNASSSGDGIQIQSNSTTGNVVAGNMIGLDAAGTARLPNGRHGVYLNAAGNCTIGGSTSDVRNIIAGHAGFNGSCTNCYGVTIQGGGASNNVVAGNYIGTDITGATAIPNYYGVFVTAAAGSLTGLTIGGVVASGSPGSAPGNVISGNSADGIHLASSAVTGATIAGNIIGLNASGAAALRNGSNGIQVATGSRDHTIGGTVSGARNVISGNGTSNLHAGVNINGSSTSGSVVQSNYICTDIAGVAALPNYGPGVVIKGAAQSNTVGGATSTPGTPPGNLISGCNRDAASTGVQIDGTSTNNNSVLGNLIGTDVTGLVALANRRAGVLVSGGAANNTIGGDDATHRNVVSGNNYDATTNGVELNGGSTTGNRVAGNYIGLGVDGVTTLANGQHGVLVTTNAFSNTIGGTTGLSAGAGCTGSCNAIWGNPGAGVRIDASASIRDAVRGNSISGNGALGIDIGPTGVTLNDGGDSDTGANNLQNFPVITSVDWCAGTRVAGTLNSTANTSNYAIEVFGNPTPDASGYGQGKTWIGTVTGVNTDGSGNASWALSPVAGTWNNISATTIDANGNTSEFALDRAVDAITTPAEVANFGFTLPLGGTSSFAWDSLAAQAGPATRYDIVRGALGELPVGSGPSETCLQNDLLGTTFSDATTPGPGAGFYYLVRGQNVCGVGTYGTRSDGTPRVTTACAP